MTIFITILIILLVLLLYLFLDTPLFFFEKEKTMEVKEENCFCEEAKSIKIDNNKKKAILCIHGFPDSPVIYSKVAKLWEEMGYDVYSPLMPGFGTSIEDFLKTNFTGWYRYIKNQYIELQKRYEEVNIVGTSMGGAMTLKLCEEFSDTEYAPHCVVCAAAPVFLNKARLGVIRNFGIYFLPILSPFLKTIKPRINKGVEPNIDGDGDWRGYSGLYPRQLKSFVMNMKYIEKDLKKITVPIYLMHSKKDKTVPYRNMKYINSKINSSYRVVEDIDTGVFDHNHHCLFLYNSQYETLSKKVDKFIKSID